MKPTPSTSTTMPATELSAELRVFLHHIYEYEKGLRRMVLCTMLHHDCAFACKRLRERGINYLVQPTPGKKRVNIFFGHKVCIDAVKLFVQDRPLNTLNPEEDFIVGALLGYDVCQQCERYCHRKSLCD